MRWGALMLCTLLLLSGCAPVAREPDNLDLVRVLGVDGRIPVTLTAVCARDNQGEVGRGSATADDFEQARKQIPWSGTTEELSLTGVSYLLISPDVNLEVMLFAILNDADLGASATVWLVKSGASDALAACNDPVADLELLTLQGIKAPTVAQAVAILSSKGEVSLPCLKEQSGRLKNEGESQWRKEN